MTGWFEVATVAFVAQLSVLPGEKGQFIIAGLSTRYHPLLVVAAAGSAFAGWTAVEIAFGNYVQTVFSPFVLNVLTGLLFLLFAVLIYRSTPDSSDGDVEVDGGTHEAAAGEMDVRVPFVDRKVPNALGGFLPIFATMAFGEFGDKTQLVTIGLATQYAHASAIWVGEMAAIVPVSLVNAFLFFRFSHRFDVRKAHLGAAGMFAFFGIDALQAELTGVSVWEEVVVGLSTFIGEAVLPLGATAVPV